MDFRIFELRENLVLSSCLAFVEFVLFEAAEVYVMSFGQAMMAKLVADVGSLVE